jgi:phosphatidylserine/phosphatidylglycerophosphate/cardiolipin synthase-like enzyme
MKLATVAAVAALVLAQVRTPAPSTGPAVVDRDIAVFFSPDGGCLEGIVWQIQSARRSIDVQAFMLSTKRIAEPLIAASRRGVKVRVIFDATQAEEEISLDEDLVQAGIPVWLDAPDKGKAHDKVMIIDGETVITGSFNFTLSADEKNTENLLVIRQRPAIARAYARHFEERLAVARKHPLIDR